MTDQHVYKLGGLWAVKAEGASKPHATARTQSDAVCIAREIARNKRSRVIVHGESGKVSTLHDYRY